MLLEDYGGFEKRARMITRVCAPTTTRPSSDAAAQGPARLKRDGEKSGGGGGGAGEARTGFVDENVAAGRVKKKRRL